MLPVNFEGAIVLGKPPGMTDEQCASIYTSRCVVGQIKFFLVCYKPSYEDILAMRENQKVCFQIMDRGRYVMIGVGTLEEIKNSPVVAWWLVRDPTFTWTLEKDQVEQLTQEGNYIWYLIAGETFPPVSAFTINADGSIN